MKKNPKVLHIITNLGQGGAERQLLELVNKKHEVCQLLSEGYYDKQLLQKNIKIYSLNMKRKIPNILVLYKLYKIINISKPDIIHCWMYHSSLLESCLRVITRKKAIPLIWGIRCSNMDTKYYSLQLKIIIKLCSYFSNLPSLIISNSYAGKVFHDRLGFNKSSIVIPNGVDTKKFSPNKRYRSEFRKEFKILEDTKVLLCVARVDPMKDHITLLKAFKKIKNNNSNVFLILAGLGTEKFRHEDKVIALGAYKNIHKVYAASDILISSSAFGEGFSNAISEGMSCGLIPISTDVGDSSIIIKNTGRIVPVKDETILFETIQDVINLENNKLEILKIKARKRIINNYSKEKMIKHYKYTYSSILENIGK